MAFLLPLFHKFLVLAELAAVRGALLLLNGSDQVLLLLILSQSIIEVRFLGHLELDEMPILHLLLISAHVLALDSARLNAAGERRRLLHVLRELLLDSALLQPSHRLSLQCVGRRALTFLNSQFELVEKAQSCTSLFLHDVVREFAIKANLEVAKCILDQVEVVDLGLLVCPLQLNQKLSERACPIDLLF